MKRPAQILLNVVRIGIGVGLLVYLGTSGAIQWPALLGVVRAWQVTLAAFVFLLLDMVVTAWRLCVLLEPRGLHLSLGASTRLGLIGMFFNACLPGSTGGDVVKIYYAAEGNRGRRTEVATIILLDRAVGMFALMLWPLGAALFFPGLVARVAALRAILVGAAIVAAGMLAGFLVCSSSRLRHSKWLEWMFREMPLGAYAERIFDTVYSYGNHGKALWAGVGISLVAHTMSTGIALLLAVAVNPGGAAWEMALLIPLGQLANTVPLTPGGLGVGEAAFNQLFSLAGYTGGAEVLLGWRLLTILLGLVGMVFYFQGRGRFVHSADASGEPAGAAEA